jgi:putative SOS response-associated peptidase YedK
VCGRYYRRSDKQRIAEDMHAGICVPFEIEPSYNIAPTTFQPVVRLDRDTGKRELVPMRWGMVPFWARDANVSYSTINAQAETLSMSETYCDAFKHRRCLVPADGYFEWKKLDVKNRQPFAIALKDGSMLAFAGIWDRWRDEATDQVLETYSIITTEPNELMATIHSRMPAILAPRDYERWLAPADHLARLPVDLLRPFDSDAMTAWRVGKDVGNVKNDSPDLIAVLPENLVPPVSGKLFSG